MSCARLAGLHVAHLLASREAISMAASWARGELARPLAQWHGVMGSDACGVVARQGKKRDTNSYES
jgi:hypothetical protein